MQTINDDLFQPGVYSFFLLFMHREEIDWGNPYKAFPCYKKPTAQQHYSLETGCHYDIWLPMLHVDSNNNLCTSSRGKPPYPLLRESVFLCPCLSLCPCKFKSINWVLWGLKLPWALCCGCLIGSVIHKRTTVHCTVLVLEASEYCFPKGEDGNIYTDCSFESYSMHLGCSSEYLIGTVPSRELMNFSPLLYNSILPLSLLSLYTIVIHLIMYLPPL